MNHLKEREFAQTALRQRSTRWLYTSRDRSSGDRGGGSGGGRRRGRMGGFAEGPERSCVCPRCGYTTSHVTRNPCYQKTCLNAEAE